MYSPAQIAKRYANAGAAKTKMPKSKMFILAMFAGMFIAFGAFGSQAAAVSIPQASFGKFIGALVFPVGLMMVIVAGAELFTGNCMLIVSVLDKKATLSGMLKNWFFVYLGNMTGSVLVAFLLTIGHSMEMFDRSLVESVVNTAQAKVSMTFGDAFIRGMLCNILVCIAIWVSFSTEEIAGKILALFLPITLFVVSGYEHSIANMYFIPAGLFAEMEFGIVAEGLTWYGFFISNLIPVTLGNIIGGAFVVGLGYYYVYLTANKE